jgi:hypothetical protein
MVNIKSSWGVYVHSSHHVKPREEQIRHQEIKTFTNKIKILSTYHT